MPDNIKVEDGNWRCLADQLFNSSLVMRILCENMLCLNSATVNVFQPLRLIYFTTKMIKGLRVCIFFYQNCETNQPTLTYLDCYTPNVYYIKIEPN